MNSSFRVESSLFLTLRRLQGLLFFEKNLIKIRKNREKYLLKIYPRENCENLDYWNYWKQQRTLICSTWYFPVEEKEQNKGTEIGTGKEKEKAGKNRLYTKFLPSEEKVHHRLERRKSRLGTNLVRSLTSVRSLISGSANRNRRKTKTIAIHCSLSCFTFCPRGLQLQSIGRMFHYHYVFSSSSSSSSSSSFSSFSSSSYSSFPPPPPSHFPKRVFSNGVEDKDSDKDKDKDAGDPFLGVPQQVSGDRAKTRSDVIKNSALPRYWNILTTEENYRMSDKYRLVSWNILAESLIDFSYIPYCTSQEVQWSHRGPLLLQQLISMDADLICLQENDNFENFFQPQLAAIGYEGLHKSRTDPGGATPGALKTFSRRNSVKKKDGCSIFYRRDAFELVEVVEVNYDLELTHLDRGNIALIAILKRKKFPSKASRNKLSEIHTNVNTNVDTNANINASANINIKTDEGIKMENNSSNSDSNIDSETDQNQELLILANTHILYNPKRGDIKLAQVNYLCNYLSLLLKKYPSAALCLCGDFNVSPASAIYEYITTGFLETKALNRADMSGQSDLDLKEKSTPYFEVSSNGAPLWDHRHFAHGTTFGRFVNESEKEKETEKESLDNNNSSSSSSSSSSSTSGSSSNTEKNRRKLPVATPLPKATSITKTTTSSSFSLSSKENGVHIRYNDEEGQKEKEEEEKGIIDIVRIPQQIWSFPGSMTNYKNIPISHGIGELNSIYAINPTEETTGEPAYSSFHYGFKGCVDYIFYTPKKLRRLGILEMPHRFHLLGKIGLPCEANPSDHLPLVTDFEFLKSENYHHNNNEEEEEDEELEEEEQNFSKEDK